MLAPEDEARVRDIQKRLDDKFPAQGSMWRHVKTGGNYRVTCCARVEATMEWVVVYVGTQRQHWTRPLAEFMDGRFTKLNEPE